VCKLIQFFWLAGFLLLQSCQQNTALKSSQSRKDKQQEAATYNVQLGMAYLQQEDRKRAKRKLLTALEQAPDSPDTHAAMAYYLEKTGDLKQARSYYKKALLFAPNSGSQLNNYGTFLCRIGNNKEAEGYFLKAVQDMHYINSAAAYENAGLCAAAVPEYEKAKVYFTKALKQDPQRVQSLYQLVLIELKQNNPAEALSDLQKYPHTVYHEARLLAVGIKAAHQKGDTRLEASYRLGLTKLNKPRNTGVKNEYNNNSE
jgi:type IV pilus assembly protein PilF